MKISFRIFSGYFLIIFILSTSVLALSLLRIETLQIVLFITILSLLGSLLLSRRLSKPIKELMDASCRIASFDFDTRIYLKDRSELRELSDSFNYMTERLKDLFKDLTLKEEEFSSIISSIQEGFLVLDRNGRIGLSNESFQRFIKEDSLEDKFYWEVLTLKSSRLVELIKRTKETKKNLISEIDIEEETFLCSITPLGQEEGTVVVLHDITELKRLDMVKKDFVVNVSHELRTPLTAIKGYAETLEEEAEDLNKHYLEIIKRHTERLINIVQDLLLLSELEDERIELELEDVNLKRLTEDVLRLFEQKVREKGLELELQVVDDISIQADGFRLEQIFINLIDNAIKYTEKGKVDVILTCKDQQVEIEVKDTGIGIPKEYVSRIFERFYVVDKSRSRRLGGTGLGLSIVKHIVSLHNGKIDVESTLGLGTRFTVILPINPV